MSSDSTLSYITVNGTTVAENGVFNISDPTTTSVTVSATPTDSNATYSVSGDSGLQIGSNTITITVTAQDLSTSDHTITVYVGNNDSSLSSITVNNKTVSEGAYFYSETGTASVTFTATPSQSTSSITSITASDANATVSSLSTDNNNVTTVTIGNLSSGLTTITIYVTAQNTTSTSHNITLVIATALNITTSTQYSTSITDLSNNYGYTLTNFYNDGIPASALTSAGFTITQLDGVGYSSDTALSFIKVNGTTVAENAIFNIAYGTTSVDISANTRDINATFVVSDATKLPSGIYTKSGLQTGMNTITTIVTAQDTRTASRVVYVDVGNNDSTISSIKINEYTITENATFYVATTVTSKTITITPTQPTSRVSNISFVNGSVSTISTTPGTPTATINGIQPGSSNTLVITVTAQDTSTSNHTIYINSISSKTLYESNIFSISNLINNYGFTLVNFYNDGILASTILNAGLGYTIAQLNTAGYPSDSALSSITVNGTTVAENGTFFVTIGTTSVTVSAVTHDNKATYTVSGNTGLITGLNTVTFTVTAQDTSTSTHTVTISVGNSDTTLSLITVNGSTSVSTTFNSPSTIGVDNGTTSVIVGCIPTQSTTTVTSITGNTGLITGINTVSILVTAQNSYTSTFYVYINVAQNADSTLSSIRVNGYSVAENGQFIVPLGTTSVTVSATPTKSTSSVTNVTGNTGLVSGSNTVTITVTAENGSTSSHYVYIIVQKWLSLSNTTNIFRQSYINGFVDVSGTTLLRSSTSIIGNLVGGGSTIITRDVSMNSRLFVGGDLSINRRLFVSGNVIANYPSGSIPTTVFTGPFSSTFSSDIVGGNRLFIRNDASLNGRLSVGRDVSMNGNLQILSGNVSFGGSNNILNINNSGITINSDVSMNSRLFASNIVTTNTTLSGNSVIGGTLNSTGNVTVNNNLSVTNLTVFNGDVSMNGNLYTAEFSRFIGDVSMNSRLFVDGNISTNQNVIANEVTLTSDYRIKENVISLDSVYSVDNLHPVHYYNKLADKRDIGLIAHEVQEVYPILVNGEKDGEEYQNINYIGLIPILIREIKELKKMDKDIETRAGNLGREPTVPLRPLP